jgi:putative transposase
VVIFGRADFFSSALDERYLWAAIRYVEGNPVRAGMVETAEEHKWASAAAHCGKRGDEILSSDLPVEEVIQDWSMWSRESDKEEEIDTLRRNTQKGLPCGGDSFIPEMEKKLKRSLRFRLPGRPRKEVR